MMQAADLLEHFVHVDRLLNEGHVDKACKIVSSIT